MTFKQSLHRKFNATGLAMYRIHLLLTSCFLLGLFVSTLQPVHSSFYSSLMHESSQTQTIQLCPHLLLFSNQRHGSTWFIDSADNCRYSRSAPGNRPFVDLVYLMTEPWKHKETKFSNMSGTELADHVRQNASVKIFGEIFVGFRPRVEQLLESVGHSMDIPVVILRRDLRSAFVSHKLALKTSNWNTRNYSEKVIKIGSVNETAFQEYKNKLEEYFEDVQILMAEKNVTRVDVVDYDDIKNLEYIKLKNNECYIRNCNFRNGVLKIK